MADTSGSPTFGTIVIQLLELCGEVQAANDSAKALTRPNPVTRALKKYLAYFNKTSPEEHIEYFQEVYRKFRVSLLEKSDSDYWIDKCKISIRYGETEGEVKLSNIYHTAKSRAKDVADTREGLDVEEISVEEDRPLYIRLYMYRIFLQILHDDFKADTDKLKTAIASFEKDLDVKPGGKAPTRDFSSIPFLGETIKKLGVNLPEGTMDAVFKTAGDIFNNPATAEKIGLQLQDVMSKLETVGPGDAIGAMIDSLKSLAPEVQNAIQKTPELRVFLEKPAVAGASAGPAPVETVTAVAPVPVPVVAAVPVVGQVDLLTGDPVVKSLIDL